MAIADEPTQVQPVAGAGASSPCATCGAPLAPDQRYCLECGTRRAEARVPLDVLGGPGTGAPLVPVVAARPTPFERVGGLWGVVTLAIVALTAGIVIGRSGDDPAPVAAARAPVVNISGGGGLGAGAAAATTAGEVTDLWPAGRAGYTVELQRLPKASTDQAAADAARAAAAAKGVADVGVLDADAHGLTAEQWIVYSGVSATRAEARADLAAAKASYPDAAVVRVAADGSGGDTASAASDGGSSSSGDGSTTATPKADKTVSSADLQKQSKLSPEEFQKQSKKLPDTVGVTGKAPPKDGGEAGGGTDAESIG